MRGFTALLGPQDSLWSRLPLASYKTVSPQDIPGTQIYFDYQACQQKSNRF